MAKDQCDADEDASLTQRLVLAGGSVTEGASELTDHDVVSGGLEVAGIIKYESEQDGRAKENMKAVARGERGRDRLGRKMRGVDVYVCMHTI